MLTDFTKRLNSILSDFGYSKEDLARKAELPVEEVEKILNGIKDPTLSEITAISEGLNLSIPALFTNAYEEIDVVEIVKEGILNGLFDEELLIIQKRLDAKNQDGK